jgi:3-methyladenine DNA glycosylase AlkD
MSSLALALDTRLRGLANPEEAAKSAKYYGSVGPFLGIGADVLRIVAAETAEELTSSGSWGGEADLAQTLWGYGTHEHRLLAVLLVQKYPRPYSADTWDVCAHWLDETDNWAIVDAIAVEVLGEMVIDQPERVEELRRWTASENFWRQRAAVMAMLPLNCGDRVHAAETFEMCQPLMLTTEPHVRTALAWVIREVGTAAPDETAAFLLPYKFKVVNSLLREAARKLPRHLERAIVGG